MPDPEATAPKNPDGGAAVEEYVRVAIVRSKRQGKRIQNLQNLIDATGLNRNTIYDLFNGVPESPEPKTMLDIANALDRPVAHLWALWQGRKIEPDSIEEALRLHTKAVDGQNRLLGDLVSFVRSAAVAITEAGGGESQIQDALVAIDAAREGPAEGPGESPPSEPVAFSPRGRPDA